MNVDDSLNNVGGQNVGNAMHEFMAELFPICRSITGEGVRQTLRKIQTRIPLAIHEVPSGTQVFDWTVPMEWNIADAYIKNQVGERVVDFRASNLHVMSYSTPVRKRMRLDELRPHLFTLPDHPERIPYRTSYYKENWGFCLSHDQLLAMPDAEYEVCIDCTLKVGHLTYGELFLRGERTEEVLISCHTCHPSLCNDNLSGIAVATFLSQLLSGQSRRYSYRVLFIPGTIGSITWLALHEAALRDIRHGFVVTGVGDSGRFTYKKSRQGEAEIDRAFQHVLQHSQQQHGIIDFFPYGYDERQYCSPGFNLPMGCFMRTPHGQYSEYHTSADNLDFVRPQYLAESLTQCLSVLHVIEHNKTYINQNPKCEPQLGRRGLYRAVAGQQEGNQGELALLWVLNLSDGVHTLLDIATRSGLRFALIKTAADALHDSGLLKEKVT
jgi:aminopeptidase-like protein